MSERKTTSWKVNFSNKLLEIFLSIVLILVITPCRGQEIPLPEHPRPDFMREKWENLNGPWSFVFDSLDRGISNNYHHGNGEFDQTILVPFPWGSKLSGVGDEADIGWYKRTIRVENSWKGRRTFLTIGASDWQTSVWLDGQLVGTHEGGYTPFSFDMSDHIKYGDDQKLVIRVDDARREFTLYGKQGYGNARGIWQTVYLESRGQKHMEAVHFSPDIDNEKVSVTIFLSENLDRDQAVNVLITDEENHVISKDVIIRAGDHKLRFDIEITEPKLWSLDRPHLYQASVTLGDDIVQTYFGMRKISVMNLPNTDYPYIALNNRPLYLQLALDQSYHPDGFYTFPSDDFIREEIERSKSIGLNGIRTHIKVEVPRKLYWADRLGLLVMEDLPNSWGEPDEKMQAESEYTLRQMIQRDYNHPSIFSWVVFNETWGLITEVEGSGGPERRYLPETQDWAASMYYLAKSLDQTRLVEDNSICCGRGHTETDINSWHVYLPGWEWDTYLKNLTDSTYPGSSYNFESGFFQGDQPNINSECGNVWGYSGSTGDVDWSWDYHRMINTFRKYPKVGGWLYTEHHDVINEWNGYWRFDRGEKDTGLGELVEGMKINDFHSPVYVSTGNEICRTVETNETVHIPLYISSMTDKDFGETVDIVFQLTFMNAAGIETIFPSHLISVEYSPWIQKELAPIALKTPHENGLGTLSLVLHADDGQIIHRNVFFLKVESAVESQRYFYSSVMPSDYSSAQWSSKLWSVMDGKKMNGAGNGFFEYKIPFPEEVEFNQMAEAYVQVEVSAKELFVKDMEEFDRNQDYMKGSKVAPSSNPNSYPMTDEVLFPSVVSVSINGAASEKIALPDDPADHRGVLSWHSQLKDRQLREAGSYGYMVRIPVSKRVLRKSKRKGFITLRLETDSGGGLAIYGKDFGRYPFDPSLVIIKK